MQNSYSYSPTMHNGDPYRQTVSMAPTHSISLPPLRPDGHIQQPQAYIPSSQQLSSPPMATYYTPQHSIIYHPQQMTHMSTMPYRGYGIPITHPRPHKKEIKRRTKTGCMTCRKRRIKCDEQKPVCRNCVKSKRECMGYDPMHKNQPGSGASAQQRNNSSIACCTPQQSAHHHASSPPASTPSASTTIASSPTTTASTGITTPTSNMSYYPPASANSSFSSTASFTGSTYSTAPVTQSYPHSPVHQSYTTASLSQSYPPSTLSHFYPSTATTQTYTLPSPLPSSKTSNLPGYFQNSSPEPLHAVAAGRHLPGMTRQHGVAIY